MRATIPFLGWVGLATIIGTAAARVPDGPPEELEAFGSLVVGEWHAADSRHVFEWAVGENAIRSRSYFPDGSDWRLVSEGLWYWDADTGAIRGTVVTDGMPFHRMEYRTRVDGNRVVHRLRTFGPAAGEYRETWTFGGGRYRWTLEAVGEDGLEPVMSGVYERAGGGPGP